jgi:hypothetical protein
LGCYHAKTGTSLKRIVKNRLPMSSTGNLSSALSALRLQLMTAFSALAGLIVVGTVAYHFLEHWSWLTSFYFSVCTLTTVGYGDFYPTTDLSRMFTAVYVLVGVGIAFTSLGLIGAAYLRRSQVILTTYERGGRSGK